VTKPNSANRGAEHEGGGEPREQSPAMASLKLRAEEVSADGERTERHEPKLHPIEQQPAKTAHSTVILAAGESAAGGLICVARLGNGSKARMMALLSSCPKTG
jgi:hypothetical protein